MKLVEQVILGYQAYGKAVKLSLNRKLFFYYLVPVFFSIVLLIIGFSSFNIAADYVKDYLKETIDFENKTFWGAEYLNEFFTGLVFLVFNILFFILFMFTSGSLLLMILSPVFALMSEEADKLLTSRDFPLTMKQLMKDILRGTLITIRNSVISTVILLAGFILGFVPVVNFLVPPVLFVLSSYFYGFSYMDYTNERYLRSVHDSVTYIRKYKGVAYAIGSVYAVVLIIPFCGPFLSAFIAPLSVVAATVAMHEIETRTAAKMSEPTVKNNV